ncbi:UNVERIFIED_CONTAM: hypothetical protein GTU68_022260, partial [Idotea baltica]|nr:hypothetical protein [Idotea baltica]
EYFLKLKSTARVKARSSSNSSIQLSLKQLPTLKLFAPMKKALDLKDQVSIELSLTLWLKEEISPIIMALEENPSTAASSKIKTLRLSTTSLTFSPWQMLDPAQMVPSSSLLS